MPKLEFSTEEVEALRYWRFHHPHPHVQLKMEVIYLRSQKLGNKQTQLLCGISKATFYRYLHAYQEGGVEQLQELNFHRQESKLVERKRTLEEYFRAHPPATCAEAAAKIEERTRGQTRADPEAEVLKEAGDEATQGGTDSSQSRCQRARGIQRRET